MEHRSDTLYHRDHAPLDRDRRARRGDDEDVREDGDPRGIPGGPDARRAADRGRVPDRPAVPRGGPALDRRGLVGASAASVLRVAAADPDGDAPRLRPLVGRRDGRGRGARRRPATRPTRRTSPRLPEVEAAFEAIEAASGAAAKAEVLDALIARSSPRTATGIVKVLSGELRIGLREGLLEAAIAKAFDRPLDAVKRAGMLTGDVGRTATLAREDRLGEAALAAVPPAQVHARVARRGRRGDPRPARAHRVGRGQVRRHPRPAPPGRRRGAPVLARPARHQRPVPRGRGRRRAGCRGPGSSTASCWPGRTASCCRSCSSRRASAARTRRRRSSPRSR